MRQLTIKESYKIITKICKLDATLEDIGFPKTNEFRVELSTKVDNLHNLVLRLEAEEAKKPKVISKPSVPLWYDVKLKVYMQLTEMHTYHLLNAKRAVKYCGMSNPQQWIDFIDDELRSRHENLPNLDGAPNLLERRV